jgi:hypothetical protein
MDFSLHVEKGILLTGERSVKQIFGGGAGAYCIGIVAATDLPGLENFILDGSRYF